MIILPKYLFTMKCMPHITKEAFIDSYPDIRISDEADDSAYCVGWGVRPKVTRGAALETGFLWDGAHLDTSGLYQTSVVNDVSIDEQSFSISIDDVLCKLKKLRVPQSKYRQTTNPITWDGVVLAAQNPGDRSILSVGSSEDYWSFIDKACSVYKHRLLIKLHPWNSGDIEARYKALADSYGARAYKCDHSCITNCKFVLVYNSTFSFDCFCRNVPVAQYAPGYFYKTKAVTYTNRVIPDSVNGTCSYARKLCTYLINKYMFNFNMPVSDWVRMLYAYETAPAGVLFPLPEHLSYAHYIMSKGEG